MTNPSPNTQMSSVEMAADTTDTSPLPMKPLLLDNGTTLSSVHECTCDILRYRTEARQCRLEQSSRGMHLCPAAVPTRSHPLQC